jgi:hypothetical protein
MCLALQYEDGFQPVGSKEFWKMFNQESIIVCLCFRGEKNLVTVVTRINWSRKIMEMEVQWEEYCNFPSEKRQRSQQWRTTSSNQGIGWDHQGREIQRTDGESNWSFKAWANRQWQDHLFQYKDSLGLSPSPLLLMPREDNCPAFPTPTLLHSDLQAYLKSQEESQDHGNDRRGSCAQYLLPHISRKSFWTL